MLRTAFLAAAALVVLPAAAHAQVGSLPAQSPFKDIEYRQELTPYAGWFLPGTDPAKVAPRGGPAIGLRYDARIGGPASFTARLTSVFSERRVLDPTKPVATRDLGARKQGLYLADVGLTINLTGQKSWHALVPYTGVGAGIASDFKGVDAGGYKFGTTFAFNFGTGVRWLPTERVQLRADMTDWLYQIQYPNQYYVPTTTNGSDAVLPRSQATSVWKHNLGVTLGVSYLFFR